MLFFPPKQVYKVVSIIQINEIYEIAELHAFQRHLPYLALSLAAFSGVIVFASLNLALASGVLSLFTVGDPLSIAFSRFLMPQSGFIVNVLLNDSVGMATPPYGKSIS